MKSYKKVQYLSLLLVLFCFQNISGQIKLLESGLSNENYVYTIVPQVATTNTSTLVQAKEAIRSVTYFDGLGRAKQSVGIKQSTSVRDIVTHIEYDALGRRAKEYLSYASTSAGGSLKTDALVATNNYYKANYSTDIDVNLPNPFSEKEFDNSPLNRVMKQAAPGKDWKLGSGHEIEFSYGSNTNRDVREYYVTTVFSNKTYVPTLQLNIASSNNYGYYNANELYKTVTEDENHTGSNKTHTTEEFKNKQGQVVLKRTYITNTITADTYYIYDNFGNLTYVLPPKSDPHSAKPDSVELSELCYQYKYDHRNRLVEKKIPGKGREYIIYDKLDRPVLTQDANLKTQKKWLFTKYDILGRVAYTGVYTHATDISRIVMQTYFNSQNLQNTVNAASKMYETKLTIPGVLDMYYSNVNFPVANSEVLTVNYYDNYTFNKLTAATSVNSYGVSFTTRTKGLATGSRIKVLGESKWITTVSYYDEKARPIYVYSNNAYLETIDVVESRLEDFTGILLENRSTHIKSGKTIVTIDTFTYDHMQRLLSQSQCIGDETLTSCNNASNTTNVVFSIIMNLDTSKTIVDNNSITLKNGFHVIATANKTATFSIAGGNAEHLVSNTYDDLGQLQSKKVGNTIAKPLQKVDYDYNVRGWLKNINEDNLNDNDLFNFTINYNDPTSSGTALFNGNISQTSWSTLSEDKSSKTYNYRYDALNRITGATGVLGDKYDVSGIRYDKNGNIRNLIRRGHLDNTTTPLFGEMDNLVYDYGTANGNKLLKVTDTGVAPIGVKGQFQDKNKVGNDYAYDLNGNMTSDKNKEITNITYNHLNLPTRVTIDGKNIDYTYDATGTKLKKVVNDKTTDYAGNYIYKNNTLQFFNQPEGYVSPVNASDISQGFKYVYQYKDHLGNVRLSYTDNNNDGVIQTDGINSEIVEESNYYPFGLKHKGYNNNVSSIGNSTAQKFGFQGQELQEELGLNWSSFKWRNADPALGRFMNIDPLAEDYSYQSPYNFAENRVIDGIELEGLEHLSHTVYAVHKDTKGNYNATHSRSVTQRNVGDWSGTKHQNTYNVYGSDGNVSAIYSGQNSTRDMSKAGISLSSVKNREVSAKDIINGASNNKEFQKAGKTLENVATVAGMIITANGMAGASMLSKVVLGSDIAISVDDLTAGTESNGKTAMEKAIGEKPTAAIKAVVNTANAIKGALDLKTSEGTGNKVSDTAGVIMDANSAKENVQKIIKKDENQ